MISANYDEFPERSTVKLITRAQFRNMYNLSDFTLNKLVKKYPECVVKIGKSARFNTNVLDKLLVGKVEI